MLISVKISSNMRAIYENYIFKETTSKACLIDRTRQFRDQRAALYRVSK